MASQNIIDIFEDCTRRLASGQTVDQCLSDYADQAERLRPLLEATEAVRALRLTQTDILADRELVWDKIVQQLPEGSESSRRDNPFFPWIIIILAIVFLVSVIWLFNIRPNQSEDQNDGDRDVIAPLAEETETVTPMFTMTSESGEIQVTLSETSSATDTASPTPTISSTETSTHTPTVTKSSTPTPTVTITPSNTASNLPTATVTNTNTATPTLTLTATHSQTPNHTATVTSSSTPTLTMTPSATNSRTPSPTSSPTNTATVIPSVTPLPTATFVPGCGAPLSAEDAINKVLEIYPNTTITSAKQVIKFGDRLVWEVKTSHGIEVNLDLGCGYILTIEQSSSGSGDSSTNDNNNLNDNTSDDNSDSNVGTNTNTDDNSSSPIINDNDNTDNAPEDDNSGMGSDDNTSDDSASLPVVIADNDSADEASPVPVVNDNTTSIEDIATAPEDDILDNSDDSSDLSVTNDNDNTADSLEDDNSGTGSSDQTVEPEDDNSGMGSDDSTP